MELSVKLLIGASAKDEDVVEAAELAEAVEATEATELPALPEAATL